MSVTINGTTGIDTIQDGIVTTAKIAADAVTTPKIADTVALGRRNLVDNSTFVLAQRGTSSTGQTGNGGFLTVDRWQINGNSDETFSVEQATDGPDGIRNSFKYTCTTADTDNGTGDYRVFQTGIEGLNLQHLKYGTSDAKQLTLSFWIKASITGKYGLSLFRESRIIGSEYTVTTANTWEYKTVTFSGDTNTAIPNDNTNGMRVQFHLGASSTYSGSGTRANNWEAYSNTNWQESDDVVVYMTTNATWQVTGIQLEVGSTATELERRSYGEELQICKRYFEKIDYLNTEFVLMGIAGGTNNANGPLTYTEKRVAPTVDLPNAGQGSGNISYLTSTGGYPSATGDHSIQVANTKQCRIYGFSYTGLTAGGPSYLFSTGATSISIDAEL